jgi:hypothetical protein
MVRGTAVLSQAEQYEIVLRLSERLRRRQFFMHGEVKRFEIGGSKTRSLGGFALPDTLQKEYKPAPSGTLISCKDHYDRAFPEKLALVDGPCHLPWFARTRHV